MLVAVRFSEDDGLAYYDIRSSAKRTVSILASGLRGRLISVVNQFTRS